MSYNTIKLKKYFDVIEEYTAAATITPGMILEHTTADKVQAHSAAGQNVIPIIALEDELQGNGIDDNYSADDQVQCWVPLRGEIAYLILEDGENAAIGNLLESAGDGRVQVHTADTEAVGGDSSGNLASFYSHQIIGEALEALNLSESSGGESSAITGHQRIKVRII